MKSALQISNDQKISSSLFFFVVTAAQIGVGIHGFQRVVVKNAGNDAWISVILASLFAHIVVFIMIRTLALYPSNDLYGIHLDIFGKYFGGILNFTYVLYCTFAFYSVIRNYIEVINTWVFPNLSQSFIAAALLILVIYAFTGGLRVLVGVCFFSFMTGLWILIILFMPLEYAHYNHILPILGNDLKSIFKGAYSMTFTIVGFEIINTLYPFAKEKKKVQKYVHLALLFTLFIYLSVILVSLVYFSEAQIERTLWATLTLFTVIKLPFIERVEIIIICFWMIIILPNLCLFSWAAYRGVKRFKSINETTFIWIFSIFIFFANIPIQTRTEIDQMNNFFAKIAFYIVFIYPFLLYIMASLKSVLRKGGSKE
ncbi:GerAB/ArcD/ProY family transporter [Ureibacillus aquaedulcis]|uniref:GerAB/ArcD/ProY family transporter n=1 Tax=Ureibacillus aquaedulcis TaxID=3058421 RepID=A0ABT8GMU1_9BACL|nr:GerAB/ArcD/ProY family transporter [Ureibacillus sp. BA0131]MDN4492569.1 GerAB/ArcD/ProY family transporter [Ureibacillus sp. BA0131]